MKRTAMVAAWAGLEYLAYPALMFLATPYLMRHLGVDVFGLWMLVTTIAATWGLANVGVAPTITRYVAMHRDEVGLKKAVAIVRFGLGSSLVAGACVSAFVMICAPWLSDHWFSNMGEKARVVTALRVGALLIVLAQIEFAFKSALKGFEMYGLAARFELLGKALLVVSTVLLARGGAGIAAILTAVVIFALLTCVVYAIVTAREMGWAICLPIFRNPEQGAASFAGWNWMQAISGVLFHQLDRMLIGALLGAAPLGAYAVCLQVAQQIHALPAALFSFILPRMSRSLAAGGAASGQHREAMMLIAGVGVAFALGLPVMFLSSQILKVWMGEAFATQYSTLMCVLAGAYLLLSVNVVPHYINLARGYARYISILNFIGGALGLILCVILIYNFEVLGAAASKFVFGFVLLVGYLNLRRMK